MAQDQYREVVGERRRWGERGTSEEDDEEESDLPSILHDLHVG